LIYDYLKERSVNSWMLLLVGAVVACGQGAFDVASVKPSSQESRLIGVLAYPGGRVLIRNQTLGQLVQEAFNVAEYQVSGGPQWIRETRYDIDARAQPGSGASPSAKTRSAITEGQRQMLQALLKERFQLQWRRELRDGSVYLLVRTHKQLKLVEAKNAGGSPWVGAPQGGMIVGSGIAGVSVSMATLASRLSPYLERPVLDRTGLQGSFDFRVEYGSEEPGADITSSILTSIQELGLKLESGKGPIETIVIESAERPAAN
jgi:uncharacterized protein (TIGR03435 family)